MAESERVGMDEEVNELSVAVHADQTATANQAPPSGSAPKLFNDMNVDTKFPTLAPFDFSAAPVFTNNPPAPLVLNLPPQPVVAGGGGVGLVTPHQDPTVDYLAR